MIFRKLAIKKSLILLRDGFYHFLRRAISDFIFLRRPVLR